MHSRNYILHFIAALIFFTNVGSGQQATVQVNNLRCEMFQNPLGIDVTAPRFSWELSGDTRGLVQVAYQVMIASTKAKLDAGEADLWNSGRVNASQSVHVKYKGKPLASRKECFWKVRLFTNHGETGYSPPAYFSMGLLNQTDWKAKWIGLDRAFPWDSVTQFSRLSAHYFRKEFQTTSKVKKATAYICGLGLYELYINGQKIGDQVLAPSPTDYDKNVKYNSFDVTGNIRDGINAVATVLGNGRYFTMRQNYKPKKWHAFGFPKMLLQIEIEYTNGIKQWIISDGSWKATADGPIRTNNEYDGEEYDATKEMPGWNNVGFKENNWLNAELVKAPGGKLEAQMNENMKVMDIVRPVSIKPAGDKYILDIGQNMAGWLRMKVQGKKGDIVTLRFAESLQPDGELYRANLRDAIVTDVYTLSGNGVEDWHPIFVYHGFRYVEISNYPGVPALENFTGEVVYDEMKTIGSFETSNSTINQVYKNAYWGIRSNYKGMPVDCPQRNERQPWLGDRATGAYGESFIFDNERLYSKWLDDIEASQTTEGSIPDVAPSFWYYYKDNMTWPGTYLMIANTLYQQYADKQPIIKHYASMKKWLMYMKGKYLRTDYIITKDSYGDWCVPPESLELIHSKDSTRNTDPKLLATAYYYYLLQLMEGFAGINDKPADAAYFKAEASKVKTAFNNTFYNAGSNYYSNNTVTANILPLSFGMIPAGDEAKVFDHITKKILIDNGGHISTGVIGTQWLMRGLTNHGRADVAYQLASNTTYPSWGYMAANGATTIWELWNGNTANPKMNSQNHVMLLGDLIVWFYENLAGIKSSDNAPGFKQIIMNPVFVEGLDSVNASYHSIHGLIKSNWKKEQDHLTWDISVPGNTTVLVYLPASSVDQIRESEQPAVKTKGIKLVKIENGKSIFELASGVYHFNVKSKE